ncbi:hypothetical protein Hanom_Chr12g01069701 [Helianthus anomalus]
MWVFVEAESEDCDGGGAAKGGVVMVVVIRVIRPATTDVVTGFDDLKRGVGFVEAEREDCGGGGAPERGVMVVVIGVILTDMVTGDGAAELGNGGDDVVAAGGGGGVSISTADSSDDLLILVLRMPVMLFDYDIHRVKMVIRICMMFRNLQRLKNKQSFFWQTEEVGPPLLICCRCLQIWFADYRHFTSEKTNNTLT